MGMMKIIVLLASMSLGLAVLGMDTPMTNFLTGQQNIVQIAEGIATPANLLAAAGAIAVSIVLGGWNFVYIITAPMLVGLMAFVTQPVDVLNSPGLPMEVRTFIQAIYAILMIAFAVYAVSWWKGGEP